MQTLALKRLDVRQEIGSRAAFIFFNRIPNFGELRTIFGEPSSREPLLVQDRQAATEQEATVNRESVAAIRRP